MYRYRPTAVLLNAVLVLPPVRSRCDWRWIAVWVLVQCSMFSVHKHQFRWQAGKEPGIFVASAEAQGVTSKSLRLWLRVLVRGKGSLGRLIRSLQV